MNRLKQWGHARTLRSDTPLPHILPLINARLLGAPGEGWGEGIKRNKRMAGFTFVEVLVAIVLITVALIPTIDALQPATLGSGIHRSHTAQHYHLTAKLEELLAEPFGTLDDEALAINDPTVASTFYSDATTEPARRLVYLSRYDADNADGDSDFFTGKDAGLVWLRIEIAGTRQAIEGLTSLYD